MPLVRRIQRRGSNIVVEANGEVLFAATGDVGRWTNRFSQRVRAFAAAEAPTNKRPRWGHYGKPLKSTFTASTTYQPGRMRVYAAIGSSARHAWYVDQGTGIYNGSGPYEAKVLPPWQRGEGSLYEATWRPGGPGTRRVRPVMIKGQKGQGFFDAGLRRAFQSMRMRAFQSPGDPKITEALGSLPSGMDNFAGNTVADGAFVASLQEWRAWRDSAWNDERALGRNIQPQPRLKPRPPRKVEANLRAYQASIEASKRRAEEQRARLAAERARREEGRRRAEEQARKLREANALRAGNLKSLRDAQAFYARIKAKYPDATFRLVTTFADGVQFYRVSYTTADGRRISRPFAYGYGTRPNIT